MRIPLKSWGIVLRKDRKAFKKTRKKNKYQMKIKQLTCVIDKVRKIRNDVYLFCLISPYLVKISSPGQFLHIKVNSTILRRPFSIYKVNKNKIYIFFKVKGRGTVLLSRYRKGDNLDVIGPLGRGFDVRPKDKEAQSILVAGGMGVAPLVFLGEKLKAMQNTKHKTQNSVLLGAKNKDEVLCEREFTKLGFKVFAATEDGSRGYKGTVLDLLQNELLAQCPVPYVNIYACGPKEMFFKMAVILKDYSKVNCQVSFEQFMGCGLGVCCGCTIETKNGYKKVCKDGPVFDIKDIG